MTFDGVPWSSAILVPVQLYAPRSPFTSDVLSRSLVTAYMHARKYGRMAMSWAWPWNAQAPIGEQGAHARVTAGARTSLAEVDLLVEATWTHATAIVVHTIAAGGISYAHHRLSAYDGSTTNTGTESSAQNTIGGFPSQASSRWEGIGGQHSTHYDLCDVSLSGLTLDGFVRFTLEGYATTWTYRPVYCALVLELRD